MLLPLMLLVVGAVLVYTAFQKGKPDPRRVLAGVLGG